MQILILILPHGRRQVSPNKQNRPRCHYLIVESRCRATIITTSTSSLTSVAIRGHFPGAAVCSPSLHFRCPRAARWPSSSPAQPNRESFLPPLNEFAPAWRYGGFRAAVFEFLRFGALPIDLFWRGDFLYRRESEALFPADMNTEQGSECF